MGKPCLVARRPDGAGITGTGELAAGEAVIAGAGVAEGAGSGGINYALLNQIQRDRARLDAKKSQIAEELVKWRSANRTENAPSDSGLDQQAAQGGSYILPGSGGTQLLGSPGVLPAGSIEQSRGAEESLASVGHDTVISHETIATIERIKRNNDLALILIMANV